MKQLTRREEAAIKRLRSAFATMPSTLRVYVVDDALSVSKRGTLSSVCNEHISRGVSAGEYLHELHDQLGAEERTTQTTTVAIAKAAL